MNLYYSKPKGLEKNKNGVRKRVPGSQRKFVIPMQGCIYSLDYPIKM